LCEHPGEQVIIKEDETLDDLTRNGLRVIQARQGYRFSMDAVLLSEFAATQPGEAVLDLGCGSGVVSFLIAARQPSCSVTGLEIQEDLAERARRGVALNGLGPRVQIINGDLRQAKVFLKSRKFDLVVVNPPFWRVGEGKPSSDQENLIARHEVKATLEDYIDIARCHLNPKGRLVLVHRASRLIEIGSLCLSQGMNPERVRMVHSCRWQEANLVLLEAVKGSKAGMRVLPPLVVYDDHGNYTDEISRIYYGD